MSLPSSHGCVDLASASLDQFAAALGMTLKPETPSQPLGNVRGHDGINRPSRRPILGVPTHLFMDTMDQRWRRHGNTVTPALRATWEQIASTFNRKLQEVGRPQARDWHVLSPATGSGKTESAIVYASLLPTVTKDHGMLIVTRRIAAADQMASAINGAATSRSGKRSLHHFSQVAIAHHSEARVTAEDMRKHAVLVITHAAFERAVERTDGGTVWDTYVAYGEHGKRDLIVIDEAVDLLELTHLTEDSLARLVGAIPGEARKHWRPQYDYLDNLLRELRRWIDTTIEGEEEPQRVMRDEHRARFDEMFGNLPDFSELRQFMSTYWYVGSARKGTKVEANRELQSTFSATFDNVEALVRSFVLFAKQGKRTSFNSARLILPEDAQGCVILDATAGVNRFYDVAERTDGSFRIHRHVPPKGARCYANVKLRVARVGTTGKGGLAKVTDDGQTVGAKESQRVLSWFQNRVADGKVFLACHKDNGPLFAGVEGLKVGTYGATDGSNAFRDCDTAVIFGLPWRDRVDATLTFFATQGVQPDEWLRDDTLRAFKGYSDIREELYLGWTATDLVQIVNRTAMRRVVDTHGNCPPCELYVMLPHGHNGDRILETLKEQLPGIVDIEAWEYTQAARRAAKPSEYGEKLKRYAADMEQTSRVPAKYVREAIGAGERQWKNILADLKSDTSDLFLSLKALGVAYVVEGRGRGAKSFLARS